MKKIVVFLCIFGLIVVSAAEVNKEEVLKKITEKMQSGESITAKIEMNMNMMGNIMTIPTTYWKQGEKFRMEMEFKAPNMEKPMEQIMIFDGKKMWQYQKAMNTVMVIDMEKLPEKFRDKIKEQQGMGESFIPDFKKLADKIEVEEKTKDGKNFYLLAVNDLNELSESMPMQKSMGSQQFFTKMVTWINKSTYMPERIEFYGASDTPGMWMTFKDLKTGKKLSSSLFTMDIPPDAKIVDMTDMMLNMGKSMKQGTQEGQD
jgi:outer membrane lipoprotein-sorting protein